MYVQGDPKREHQPKTALERRKEERKKNKRRSKE
jgi:hypothetical protein